MSAVVKMPLGFAAFVGWMGLAFGGRAILPASDGLGPANVPTYEVTGLTLYDGDQFATPVQLTMFGDHIALADGNAVHPVHVLDAEGRYVAGLGREGEGPGEFKWPRTLEPAADGAGFWVFDMELSRLTLVEPGRWSTMPASSRITLSLHGPAFLTGVVRRAEGGFLAAGFFADGRLGHYTGAGSYERASGPMPRSEIEAPAEVIQHAYQGTLKADPTGRRLVMANRHAGFLEVYSGDGELVRRIRGPFEFEPRFEVTAGEKGPALATGADLRFGYIDVAPTADRIYALFSGRTRAAHPDDATYGRDVHVFDWEGRQLSVLHLDADVVAIAVDTARDRLLAVRHLPTPALVAYDLVHDSGPIAGERAAD